QLAGPRRVGLTNAKLYLSAQTAPLENIVRRYRLRWAGHVRRRKTGAWQAEVGVDQLLRKRFGKGRNQERPVDNDGKRKDRVARRNLVPNFDFEEIGLRRNRK
ncbi:hypothetical protein BpHYR1_028151, partial [Brachionus plicatilis]